MEENNSLAKVIAVYGSVIDAVFCRSRAAVIGTMPMFVRARIKILVCR